MVSLFPPSGFDQVTTPVLVGVLVSWFFTEMFGWVFVGLVVPGYLASVFLLDPACGVIDLVEAVLTYGAARTLGEWLPRTGLLSRSFGRERFFLVLVVSVLVRLAVEGWALPHLLPRSAWAFSIGLVVVPLAANACWKTGLFRGFIQNGIPTLIVYLVLRYVLVSHTNLSLEGFELATENVAAQFLASPKAYILLVVGALLAASANIRYGWDFNGILVPALLGLVIVEPTKLAATFIETLVVYGVALLLIRITPLRSANIEGPRRPVLFFSIDYALRFAFAFAMGRSLPGGDIVAFTGFGYLLPTLLAVKISQKSSAPLVLLPTFKVGVAGFAAGTLLGFIAHRIDVALAAPPPPPALRPLPPAPADARAAALWVGATALVDADEPDTLKGLERTTLRARLEAAASGDEAAAAKLGLDLWRLDDGVVLLRERSETFTSRVGAPAYVLRAPIGPAPVVVLVPEPIAHPTLALVAGGLVADRKANVAVIAGVEEPARIGLETVAHSISRTLAQGGTLEVVRARGEAAKSRGLFARFAESDLGGKLREERIEVDENVIARTFSPAPDPVPLDTSLAMGLALEDVKPTSKDIELEHQVVLRRFVLPAIFGEPTPSIRSIAPFVASSIGYTWKESGRWIDGAEAIALLPSAPDRAVAILARKGGERRRVLVAPFATDHPTRDAALRLAIALRVDAIVLGQAFDHALRAGLVRAAIATLGPARPGTTQTVFIVRQDQARGTATASLSSLLDDGAGRAEGRRALESLGAEVAERPMDPAMREIAVRTSPDPKTFVTITLGPKGLAGLSLDGARHAAARFGGGVRAFDGSLADAAAALYVRFAPITACPEDIETIVRAAGSDLSVNAGRRLALELSRGCAVAAFDRAAKGAYLAVIARTPTRTLFVSASIDGGATFASITKPTFAECLGAPPSHGVCAAEVRR
jgi:hypothetical protein